MRRATRGAAVVFFLSTCLWACGAGSPPASTTPPASSAATGPQCGPAGAKCDPNAPPCLCPDNMMCHGMSCSGGVWSEIEVFPASPGH